MTRETTHIEIGTDTRRRLRVWKAHRDMTYDEAINDLLDETEETDNTQHSEGDK